jgi:ribosomal protein L7/L12
MYGDLNWGELNARVLELERKVEFLLKNGGSAAPYVPEVTDADRQVADVLRTGTVIEAIKVYRGIYDVDLASAKEAVEAMKSRMGL